MQAQNTLDRRILARRLLAGPAVLAAVVALAALAGCDSDSPPCQCPAEAVINCGHRGTGVNRPENPFPENTLPSFEQAVTEGAEMVELDVQHTADGVLVVMHDETVSRTTDGTACLGDLTFEQVRALDAAFGTSLEGTGVVVPTLEEVMADVDVPINVEIKIHDGGECPPSDRDALAADVVAAIAADQVDRTIMVSSFDLDVLLAVQALDDTVELGYLTLVSTDADTAASHGFASLNVLGGLLTVDDVAAIRDLGLGVAVWTIDDPDLMADLASYGISMLITDDPDVFAQVRADACRAACGD